MNKNGVAFGVRAFPLTGSLLAGLVALAVPQEAWAQGSKDAPKDAPKDVAAVSAAPAPASGAASPVAPAAMSFEVTSGSITCDFSEHEGTPDPDARTATRIVCDELQKAHAPAQSYRVRFERLEGTVIVTVIPPSGGNNQRMELRHLSEITTAAPRLAKAVAENRSVKETVGADNLTSAETEGPRVRAGRTGLTLGLLAATTAGVATGISSGVQIGVAHRLEHVGLFFNARAGGLGADTNALALGSLDLGARYYLGDGDNALFVGGGGALGAYSVKDGVSGSGMGAFGEVGAEFLRSRRVGILTSVRADLPFYALQQLKNDFANGTIVTTTTESRYVVPLTLNFGVAWH